MTALRRSSGLRSFTWLIPTATPDPRLQDGFVQLWIRKKALEADILLLLLLKAIGLGCFHPSLQLLTAVIGRARRL